VDDHGKHQCDCETYAIAALLDQPGYWDTTRAEAIEAQARTIDWPRRVKVALQKYWGSSVEIPIDQLTSDIVAELSKP
jgi:hypothetical protein